MDERDMRQLTALVHHDAWRVLEEQLTAAEERWIRASGQRIRNGEQIPQSEIDYMRGRFDGARMLIRQPARALRQLERLDKESEPVV